MASCQIKNNKFYAPNGEESILYNSLRNDLGATKAKDVFLTAYTPTFQDQVVRKEIYNHRKNIFDTLKSNQNYKVKVEDKKGYKEITLFSQDNVKLGYIRLQNYNDGMSVKAINLATNTTPGQGVGTEIYKTAIRYALSNNVSLYSDISQAPIAQKIWNKFVEQGVAQKVGTRFKVDSLGDSFDKNAEIKPNKVYEFLNNFYSVQEPLTLEEISEVKSTMQTESSVELHTALKKAFFDKKGLFKPTKKSLRASKLYSEVEISRILTNATIQAKIKDTISKLANTEEFFRNNYEYNENFLKQSAEINSIGNFKVNNPLKEEALYIEENGGKKDVEDLRLSQEELDQYKRIPVVDEEGNLKETELFYDDAVKDVEVDSEAYRGLSAIANAPANVDTTKLEVKVSKWLKDYGFNLTKGFRELKTFLDNPTAENKQNLYDAIGYVKSPQEKVIKIENKERDYIYLETNKSEEELFDTLSLVKTNTPNVYHRVTKIDEAEMRDIVGDIFSKEYKLYRNYFGYDLDFKFTKQGGNKAVDKSGEPVVVYRGGDITSPIKNDKYTVGRFFTTSRQAATAFGTKINSAVLFMKNPFTVDAKGEMYTSIATPKQMKSWVADTMDTVDTDLIAEWAYKNNYDGVIIKNVQEGGSTGMMRDANGYGVIPEQADDYIVFDNSQIKDLSEKQSQEKQVQTNFEGGITTDFVADFSAEIIKNPNHPFYSNFKITENGIEIISQDNMSMDNISFFLENDVKLGKELQEYSLLSKHLPNLKSPKEETTKQDRRVQAVNNVNLVKEIGGNFVQINGDIIAAKDEDAEFIKSNNQVYELQEKDGDYNYYVRLEKNNDLKQFNFDVSPPKEIDTQQFKNIMSSKEQLSKVKKLWKDDVLEDNFACQ